MRGNYSLSGNKKAIRKVVGDVRQTQLITSFGCGAIVDFVTRTVMIAGIDKWDWAVRSPKNQYIIKNESLQSLLDVEYFVKPKVDEKRTAMYMAKSKDIPAYVFPEVLYCTHCHRLINYSKLDHQTGKQLSCTWCKRRTLLPSSFVAVCAMGHIEDFPYSLWVHRGKECPKSKTPELKLINAGGKSGLSNLLVVCLSCNEKRGMQGAFMEDALVNIKKCESSSPWLHKYQKIDCPEKLRTRMRTSTNVHFPVTVSALSIPPWSAKMFRVLEGYYDILKVTDEDNRIRIIEELISFEFPAVPVSDIFTAFKEMEKIKESSGKKTQKQIYKDEYSTFIRDVDTSEEFSAQAMDVPIRYRSLIKRVVAVDKLTEVVALKGFVRVNAWSGDIEDERIAKLSTSNKPWLPAIKMSGEGIFIEFEAAALKKWAETIQGYYDIMKHNLDDSYFTNERFSEQYVLLHTFAHLLIHQLSIECGYSAASIKEKIYSTFFDDDFEMNGILIYTASSDSDGSLGGLVTQSDPDKLATLFDGMISNARWCSSDPLCISSFGENGQGVNSLNYAACYSCALLPETSCEFRNLLLDRGSVIGRQDKEDLGIINYLGIEV